MDKILLIDFNNFLWRASVGFSKERNNLSIIQTEEEKDQVMIYNFFRNIRPIIELFAPDKCFIVMDGYPQFRYDLLSTYKSNRIIKTGSSQKQDSNDRFHRVKDKVVQLLLLLPVTLVKANKFEADDCIGQICENLKDEHLTVVSSDGDYTQILQRNYKNAQLYNPIKKEFIKAPDYHFIQHKCLLGDQSDCIKGLLKPKKAMMCALDPSKFKEFMSIEENRANFSINRQLVEFHEIPEEDLIITEGKKDFYYLKQEFKLMKFESIINDKSWEKYKNTFNCLKY